MPPTLDIDDSATQFQIPTLVTWNRIESRPRHEDFDRSLRAEVRDALWMLTRQWQLGEFTGEDAASPVFARIKMETTQLTKFQDRSGTVGPLDYSRPLETRVERLPVVFTLALRLQMGRYWLRMLRSLGLSTSIDAEYKANYPIELPEESEEVATLHAHRRVVQLYAASEGRGMDGGAFYEHLAGGGAASDGTSLTLPEQSDVNDLGQRFLEWFAKQYDQPSSADEICWEPEQLEHAFSVSAPLAGDGSSEQVLVADEYRGGHLDWFSFDIDPAQSVLGAQVTPDAGVVSQETLSFLPAPIEFAGMPNVRWWEFEDRYTDFGDIDANTTDTAKLLLIEFGLLYANDWFLAPFVLPIGSLAQVAGLEVTDNFGQRTWVERAGSGAENDWERWNLYTMNQRGDVTVSDDRLLLAPAIGKGMQSQPVESVNLLRDEMANLVWAVEGRVPLENGLGKSGFRAATELRTYLKGLLGVTEKTTEATETDANIRYKVGTTVPENWIPFVPVRAPDSDREIELQRGAMLRILPGIEDTPGITPRTRLLLEGRADGEPFYVHEEEVPRSGTIVKEAFQRTRWHGGSIVVWTGRRRSTGSGEKSSGLKFDQLKRTRKE